MPPGTARRRGVEVSVGAGSELSLLVRDNGIGIRDTARRSGLANLAQRAEQYGGTLTVGPAAGGGTELDWRVPLVRPAVTGAPLRALRSVRANPSRPAPDRRRPARHRRRPGSCAPCPAWRTAPRRSS